MHRLGLEQTMRVMQNSSPDQSLEQLGLRNVGFEERWLKKRWLEE